MRIVEGKQVCSALIGAAGAWIGEVLEAVEGDSAVPLVRVLARSVGSSG